MCQTGVLRRWVKKGEEPIRERIRLEVGGAAFSDSNKGRDSYLDSNKLSQFSHPYKNGLQID